MKYKGLLFDLDGVIVDTAKYHYLAWKELADELGIPFNLEDNERLKGVSRLQSLEIILEIGNRAMSADQKAFYCTRKNERYVSYIRRLTKEDILPNVMPFLLDVQAKGYKTALGTVSKNSGIILDGLGISDFFDAIIDGNDITNSKPDPEVFLKGAEALGLVNEACIVFEDAFAGIEAAHNAGMKAIGIGDPANLPNAEFCIPDFGGITIEALVQRLQ